jgi:hypothetical protein
MRKISSPPGFDTRTVQPVASCHTKLRNTASRSAPFLSPPPPCRPTENFGCARCAVWVCTVDSPILNLSVRDFDLILAPMQYCCFYMYNERPNAHLIEHLLYCSLPVAPTCFNINASFSGSSHLVPAKLRKRVHEVLVVFLNFHILFLESLKH